MSRPWVILLIAALPACGSRGSQLATENYVGGQPPLTLCVSNESASAGTIRVWVDNFRALTVGSGKRECRRVREVSTTMQLFAESMAGGFAGTTKYQGEIRSMGIRCWNWVLRDGSTSEIRLVPCDFENDFEEEKEGGR